MKVEMRKTDEKSKNKKNVMNGETSHDESPKDSNKRSRSRSKSPRNILTNGDLMFDAALYAPERPKRNRKKPEEEIFTPVKETFPKQPKKRKAPEKSIKKPDPKTTKNVLKRKSDKVSKVDDDGPPKPKRRCTQKKTKTEDSDDDSEPEENHVKTPKQTKPQSKEKAKSIKKNAATKDGCKGAKTPNKTGKKILEKSTSIDNENTDDERDKESSSVKASQSTVKGKKKANIRESAKQHATDSSKTPKVKERASKPKKSPAKIEIDGIEITELSDLNSSKEDDFNSSRDSINNSTENDTSVETVIYDGKVDNGAKSINHANNLSPGNKTVLDSDAKDLKENLTSVAISKQYSEDEPALTSSVPTGNCTSIPSHLHSSPLPATSSHGAADVKTEGSSPSKADPAPVTCSSLPHNHNATPNHPALTSATKPPHPPQLEGEKKLPCPQPGCKYVGKSGVLLRKHLRNHGVFECAHCDFSGNQFELLENHMKEKHPTRWGRKKCRKCCRHIRTDLHEEHEAGCNGVKIWKCDECNHEFPYESTLKEHRKKHKKPTKYECEFCEFKCELKNQLKSHVDSNHAELKTNNHPCSKCKRTFHTQASLDTHMQLHDADSGRTVSSLGSKITKGGPSAQSTPQVDIACDFEGCEEKFKTQRLLNTHRKQQHKIGITGVMFKCEHEGCGMEFPRQAQLKKHTGVHTGERRYSCDWAGCQKTFRHNANLKIHYMQHTGEKPIHCEHCDFSCRQRSSILFHMKTKHPGMPIPRTDRGGQRSSPRRSTENPGTANNSMDEEHTQDYDFGSPVSHKPTKMGAKSIEVATAATSVTPAAVADPKVYDFPDDDEEETSLDLPVKKTTAKSPICSLSEMENRLCTDGGMEGTDKKDEREDDDKVDNNSSHEQSLEQSPAEEQESPKEEEKDLNTAVISKDSQVPPDPPASIVSESASQSSSKFSEFAQEHVSENFPMNSSEGTTTTATTPGETQAYTSGGEQPTTEDHNVSDDHEAIVENPIQGALDTTDDLDYQINGDTSDVLDDKMLRSPMSNISEDMRALDMPHVSTTDSKSAELIQEADLAISSPSKKELRNNDGDSGMPPEINAEVDALLESGLLDGHATTKDQQVASHSSPRDSFHDVLAPPHSHVSSTHPDTPSASAPGHYTGDTSSGSHGPYSSGGYTPSYEQQPQSNVSHHTPEHDQRVPPANFPLPEYPPLPSPAPALQQLPSTTSTPSSSYPQPLPPVYGSSPPSLPGYGAVVSSSYPVSSVSPFRSPPTTTSTSSVSSIPSFAGSGLAPVVTSASSFLDAALTAGRSSLDLFPSSLPSVSRPETINTASTSVPSFSTSPYSTSAASSVPGRDLFGHYFPGAPPPDPMSGLSLPPPPTQDPQRPSYPASSQAAGFQALQRTSADLLQRASLPTMNYPSVSESLARLNPSTTQSLWMPGTDDRSRSWAQASPILMPPELDAASSLSRNPFSSTRSEYNFEAAAAALGKRPESSFPGVPQSVPTPSEHRSYDPTSSYMGAAPSHFGPGAAAAAAAVNYARGMPDYRSPSAAPTDMYGRHVGAPPPPPLGLDKYYNPYSRDSMYRSTGLAAPPPPNPFLPPASNTPYSANPMYQHGGTAAGTEAYAKYLPGSTDHRPAADYFHHQTAAPPRPPTADPYDPYRRSVIHNMMTRYY